MVCHRRRRQGFSLIEICAVLAVLAIVAGIALPGYQDHLRHARRADAVAALTRLQLAQEQFRGRRGEYAERLDQLPGQAAALSEGGYYRIDLQRQDADAYRARALAQGSQSADTGCTVLQLTVEGAITRREPEPRCWLP